jgi:hypothetical protein
MPFPLRWRDHERSASQLVKAGLDALAMRPDRLAASVLGGPRSLLPPYGPHSEMRHVVYAGPFSTANYLIDVATPSLPVATPQWAPSALEVAFWHPSTLERVADRYEHPASFPDEAWFFINGIMTNDTLARVNGRHVASLFGRPVTVIQNATSGLVVDLAECVLGKAYFATTEAAKVALPPIHAALTDRSISRVVVLAHSQGTIIAANVLERIAQLYRQIEPPPGSSRYGLRTLGDEHIAKLEIYAFANCSTRMPYIDAARRRPWIESYGNEWDVVARLGMLAPDKPGTGVTIDGPVYQRCDAVGHLLSEHYLCPIAGVQVRGQRQGGTGSPEPFTLLDDGGSGVTDEQAPRLFGYLNGGGPASTLDSEGAVGRPWAVDAAIASRTTA